MTFQRARSEEQRAVRRQAILHTAEAMLAEMPVAALSLNELSRRVGLAKSNVLRYFESREAVLLELLDDAWREWLDALAYALPSGDPAVPVAERVEQIAALLARTLVDRPMLCELGSASAAVLEHNVSVEVAMRFKRAAFADTVAVGTLVRSVVPELAEASALGCHAGRVRGRPGAGRDAPRLRRRRARPARDADRRTPRAARLRRGDETGA